LRPQAVADVAVGVVSNQFAAIVGIAPDKAKAASIMPADSFAGISGMDSENSKLNIDEFTSPGDIVFTAKHLLEEIRNIPGVGNNEYYGMANSLRQDLTTYEHSIMREDKFNQEQIRELIKIYSVAYRLNRSVVHREAVVINPEDTGYWSSFAPYYM
jgi:hypothetical protein